MAKMAQTVPSLKFETTEERLTAHAGLALFGEFLHGLGFSRWVEQEMPKPRIGRGYEAETYVTPLVLMLTGEVVRWKTYGPSGTTRQWPACSSVVGCPAPMP